MDEKYAIDNMDSEIPPEIMEELDGDALDDEEIQDIWDSDREELEGKKLKYHMKTMIFTHLTLYQEEENPGKRDIKMIRLSPTTQSPLSCSFL